MMPAACSEQAPPRIRRARPPSARPAVAIWRWFCRAAAWLAKGVGCALVSLRAWYLYARGKRALRAREGPVRLCLGSGRAPIDGWVNIDLDGHPDVRLDLRKPIPARDGSVALVYSEHLLEHFSYRHGAALLRECRRVLAPDGVLRIAVPDLRSLVDAYVHDWREQDWVSWEGYEWIDSAARMINQAFYGWGHRFLYDAPELRKRLREAGFAHTCECAIGGSDHPELGELETRLDSTLIVEAWGDACAGSEA